MDWFEHQKWKYLSEIKKIEWEYYDYFHHNLLDNEVANVTSR